MADDLLRCAWTVGAILASSALGRLDWLADVEPFPVDGERAGVSVPAAFSLIDIFLVSPTAVDSLPFDFSCWFEAAGLELLPDAGFEFSECSRLVFASVLICVFFRLKTVRLRKI